MRCRGTGRLVAAGLLVGMLAAPVQAAGTWDRDNIDGLRSLIASAADEGLDPARYDGGRLDRALETGDAGLGDIADAAALRLAHDMFEGRRDPSQRPTWHFPRPAVDYRAWLDQVLDTHTVGKSFQRLLPQTAEYRGLRSALALCRRTGGDCTAIGLNLDRWRALPREFERRYLRVNIPAFRVDLVEGGRVVASHRVIVGKTSTRTPLFKAQMTGVTANPWWNVPCSIVDESIGKLVRTRPAEAARRGFVATTDAGGKLVVRQKPGPENALGRLKFEMPNPYGVYLHDTSSPGLFARETRALSHGCIRTDRPDELARKLLGGADAARLDTALLTLDTQTIRFAEPVPVYVVYLTVEANGSAPAGVRRHPDIYGEDVRERRAPD